MHSIFEFRKMAIRVFFMSLLTAHFILEYWSIPDSTCQGSLDRNLLAPHNLIIDLDPT